MKRKCGRATVRLRRTRSSARTAARSGNASRSRLSGISVGATGSTSTPAATARSSTWRSTSRRTRRNRRHTSNLNSSDAMKQMIKYTFTEQPTPSEVIVLAAHSFPMLCVIDVVPETPVFMRCSGIRDAAKRHDVLARRKYAKPFKWFKFNRARKATAK